MFRSAVNKTQPSAFVIKFLQNKSNDRKLRDLMASVKASPAGDAMEGIGGVLKSLERVEDTLKLIELNGRTPDNEVWHKRREDGQKVYCRVRCNFITVGEIDTVKQEFQAEVYLSVKWKEPAFIGKTRDDVDWSECWDPRLYFFNTVSVDKMECKHNIVPNDDDSANGVPDAQLSMRLKATFKASMDLHSFPFDYQKLTIKLMSDWPLDDVEFVKDMSIKDSIRLDTFTDGHQWRLHKHAIAEPVVEDKALTGSHRQYPIYHISTHVQRKSGFYLWNIALVIFLINSLSFTSFAVDQYTPADRLSVTVTLLLTAVAFKYVVASSLPPISYLTLLDKYVLYSLVFQSVMVCQNAFIAKITSDFNVDLVCMLSLAVAAVIINFCFLCYGGYMKVRATSKLDKFTRRYKVLCDEINTNWQIRMRRKAETENGGKQNRPASSSSSTKKNQVAPVPDTPFSNLKENIEMDFKEQKPNPPLSVNLESGEKNSVEMV